MRRLAAILGLSICLAACGGGDDDDGNAADAPPGGADSTAAGVDAPPAATPFEELTDEQLTDLCAAWRDAACDAVNDPVSCPPACDPCAQAGWPGNVRGNCAGNTTPGDVANCISTMHAPEGPDDPPCDGQAACLFTAAADSCG